MKDITKRQMEALNWIKGFCNENGFSPTRSEIGKGLGINRNAAQDLTVALSKKGFIKTTDKLARSIVILSADGA